MAKKYTKESIKKVVEFILRNPLKLAAYFSTMDEPTQYKVIKKYIWPATLKYIEKSNMQEEAIVFMDKKHESEPTCFFIKKCITDILVEEKNHE